MCQSTLAADECEFQGVALAMGNKADVEIHHGQFFTSLANHMRKRMMTMRSSGKPSNEDVLNREKEYLDLLNGINCLNPEAWPIDIDTNILYGEREIFLRYTQFSLSERSIIQGFRDFKDNGGKRINQDLIP